MNAPITHAPANAHATQTDNAANTTQLDNAPIVARRQMPEQKMNCMRELLEKSRARGVDTAEKLQQLFARQIATRQAYIRALDPDGPFTQAFAQVYLDALTGKETLSAANQNLSEGQTGQANGELPKQGSDFINTPHNVFRSTPIGAALNEVKSYVINRRDEQVAMLADLQDPAFFQEVAQALAAGYTPPPKQEGLSAQKKQVLVDELVQLNGLNKREPAIHIGHTARGHEHGHWALAKALDPKGPLASVLAGVLAPHAPHLRPDEVTKNAHDYLAHFQKLAVLVAEAMTWDGEIVTEAIRQSEASRQKSGQVIPLHPSANENSLISNRFTDNVSPRERDARQVFGTWEASLREQPGAQGHCIG